MGKTKKNYLQMRKNPTDVDILSFAKIPRYSPAITQKMLRVTGTIDKEIIQLLKEKDKLKETPEDNYYGYINQPWINSMRLETKKHKTFYVKHDDVRILQEKVANDMITITKKVATIPMKTLFESFRDLKTDIKSHIGELHSDFQVLFSKNNLIDLLVYLHKTPLVSEASPISWSMGVDLKDTRYFINSIYPAQTSFFDNSYYFDIPKSDNSRHNYQIKLRNNFHHYVKRIFHFAGVNLNPLDVVDCEISIINSFDGSLPENEDGYNKISGLRLNL